MTVPPRKRRRTVKKSITFMIDERLAAMLDEFKRRHFNVPTASVMRLALEFYCQTHLNITKHGEEKKTDKK